MEQENQYSTRLMGIDGLRAMAACSILTYHAWLYGTPSGERVNLGPISRFLLSNLPVGVTLFFTLSAFLLYRPIAAAVLTDDRRPPLRRYLRARALRIVPAYWFVLMATGLVLGATLVRVSPGVVDTGHLGVSRVLILNAGLLQNYFPGSLLTGIAPAWSLAVEVVFYATLPMLGWGAARLARGQVFRRRLVSALAPCLLLLLVGLSGKVVAQRLVLPAGGPSPGWDGDWHSVIVRSFWGQADLFAYGMALAVLYISLERSVFALPNWWRWPVASSGLVAAVGAVVLANRTSYVPGTIVYEDLMAFACACLLTLVVVGNESGPSLLARALSWRPLMAVGLFSYSLFLWHEPLIRWLATRGLTLDGRMGFGINVVMLALIAGALSALTYRFVELPALRRKSRSTMLPTPDAPSGTVAAVTGSRAP
jgi:peptidoglycan/LPS O-acetylase OafA/YrhL